MLHDSCRLPNGLTFTVTPVFGGVSFKSHDMIADNSTFPPGWTVIIHTEKPQEDSSEVRGQTGSEDAHSSRDDDPKITRFTTPTLNRDYLYISSIVNPPSSEFKPATSPTRQIAMMLWATLWWYFHEPEPDLHLATAASSATPTSGKPKGAWRVNIKRDGVFKGRNLLQKFERMGLIASEDSSVGFQPVETRDSSGWSNMFVSRRSFWQLDPRLFLFTLTPRAPTSPSLTSYQSPRPVSPVRDGLPIASALQPTEAVFHTANVAPFASRGPFTSGSHLPTYYPPAPTQYTFTDGVRHPIRPKPPHQGEVFYVRYIPSLGQYLSFRVPFVPMTTSSTAQEPGSGSRPATPNKPVTSSVTGIEQHLSQNVSSDLDTMHRWMNDPRVEAMWQVGGEHSVQEAFLLQNLTSRHSFPVIGCWDGKPFGYFEIYWVKEDRLGPLLASGADNYDRGIHLLVGEQEYRGAHRLAVWLSSLVHYCWLADLRTQTVMLEPRVDNQK